MSEGNWLASFGGGLSIVVVLIHPWFAAAAVKEAPLDVLQTNFECCIHRQFITTIVLTTGKTSFAQSRDFRREQKRGISAKKPFAERGSRQTRAVGNSQDCRGPASRQTTTLGEVGHFAESPARQKMTFGKMGLCRGPHSRQNQALGKTLPWAHRRDLP